MMIDSKYIADAAEALANEISEIPNVGELYAEQERRALRRKRVGRWIFATTIFFAGAIGIETLLGGDSVTETANATTEHAGATVTSASPTLPATDTESDKPTTAGDVCPGDTNTLSVELPTTDGESADPSSPRALLELLGLMNVEQFPLPIGQVDIATLPIEQHGANSASASHDVDGTTVLSISMHKVSGSWRLQDFHFCT